MVNQEQMHSDNLRLLTQIDTKLTILLDNFDKHVLEDKITFEKHDKRLGNLEKIYAIGIGAIVVFEFVIRFWKSN